MMSRDRIHYLRRLAVLARNLSADQRVRALDLVRQRLADIMQQLGAPRLLLVESELGRHRSAYERRFDRMHQHILRVAVAILEHPKQLDQFRMDSVHADFDNRALSGLANRFLDLLLGLAHDFLDTSRMNPSLRDELFERNSRYLATDRIVARDDHSFGSVV